MNQVICAGYPSGSILHSRYHLVKTSRYPIEITRLIPPSERTAPLRVPHPGCRLVALEILLRLLAFDAGEGIVHSSPHGDTRPDQVC